MKPNHKVKKYYNYRNKFNLTVLGPPEKRTLRNISNQEIKTTEDIKNESSEIVQKENLLPSNVEILEKISNECDKEELQKYINLFNLNIMKKNMLRVNMESELLDDILKQASERFHKRPDEISNKELLEYLTSIQTSMEKSQQSFNKLDDTPTIQVNQNKNEVNITMNETSLDRDSRERVMEVIKKILNNSESKSINELNKEVKIIDNKGD